jgi:hypothetical protein
LLIIRDKRPFIKRGRPAKDVCREKESKTIELTAKLYYTAMAVTITLCLVFFIAFLALIILNYGASLLGGQCYTDPCFPRPGDSVVVSLDYGSTNVSYENLIYLDSIEPSPVVDKYGDPHQWWLYFKKHNGEFEHTASGLRWVTPIFHDDAGPVTIEGEPSSITFFLTDNIESLCDQSPLSVSFYIKGNLAKDIKVSFRIFSVHSKVNVWRYVLTIGILLVSIMMFIFTQSLEKDPYPYG